MVKAGNCSKACMQRVCFCTEYMHQYSLQQNSAHKWIMCNEFVGTNFAVDCVQEHCYVSTLEQVIETLKNVTRCADGRTTNSRNF